MIQKKTQTQQFNLIICMAAILWLTASCITSKQVNYLQDMKHGSQIELEDKFEAVIAPYDELNIYVSCFKQEEAKPFNVGNNNGGIGNSGGNYHSGYLVDVNGNIQFPVLGEIHVAGLTRLQLQDTIKNLLVTNNYLVDPYVNVRFNNFKIFFLGADGGKAITISNERCTFLEALALSGDLNVFTDRSRIAVMREVDGKMTMRYLDPRSSEIFKDPYYLLQQNDFIITESVNKGTTRSEVSYWLGWLTTAISVTTLIVNFVTLAITSNKK